MVVINRSLRPAINPDGYSILAETLENGTQRYTIKKGGKYSVSSEVLENGTIKYTILTETGEPISISLLKRLEDAVGVYKSTEVTNG